jgi:hypothetical protein
MVIKFHFCLVFPFNYFNKEAVSSSLCVELGPAYYVGNVTSENMETENMKKCLVE